ncbi:hypothetical protein HID58_003950, partial [Brassica napus]
MMAPSGSMSMPPMPSGGSPMPMTTPPPMPMMTPPPMPMAPPPMPMAPSPMTPMSPSTTPMGPSPASVPTWLPHRCRQWNLLLLRDPCHQWPPRIQELSISFAPRLRLCCIGQLRFL